MANNNSFDFQVFIKDYEKKIGRSLTVNEIEKAKNIYANLIEERRREVDRRSAQAFLSNDKETSKIDKKYNAFEYYMLDGAEQQMEELKKNLANSTVTVNQGKRVNLKFPGKVHIIATDRSGEIIEINNKADVEHQTMAYRFDTIKDQAKSVVQEDQHNQMEFE